MAIKLTITRHVEKKKRPPTKLVVERVSSKHVAPKKAAPKKKATVKKAAPKKAVSKKTAPKKVAPKKVVASKKIAKTKGSSVAKQLVTKEVEHMVESVASAHMAPKMPTAFGVGSALPPFALVSTSGGTVTNTELLGSRYVLYFYPKDETSGCTTEAREFSKLAGEFGIQNVRIFGVSPDSLESHEHFIAKEGITYPLLVDEGHAFAKACGVWGGLFNKRTTFVIGPDGLIERVYRDVKPEGHGVCVLEDLTK